MLRNIADILHALADQERQKLDEFELKHGPTIGRMYEGLTSNLLESAVPQEIGLRIASGVIYDDAGTMTGEIDCMLVEGDGIQIPYTSSYKWHIKDVVCVFEVKKTLYGSELSDSFLHLREVLSSYSKYVESGCANARVDIGPARKAYSLITGSIAPSHEVSDSLPPTEEIIYHTLIMEQLSPIRIVLGYHGFKSEYAFREALIKFLKSNIHMRGFGVGSFPQLIVSDRYSLVKGNGQPYSPPLRNGRWDFLFSSSENPLVFILELIWTRLQHKYKLGGLWGEDLEEERFHVFLSGKVAQKDGIIGWDYTYAPINSDVLDREYQPTEWAPVFLDQNQFVVMQRLCEAGKVDTSERDFVEWLAKQGIDVAHFVDILINTRLVARDGNLLRLTTEQCQCAILPTGEFIAAENNTGRLTRWIAARTSQSQGRSALVE